MRIGELAIVREGNHSFRPEHFGKVVGLTMVESDIACCVIPGYTSSWWGLQADFEII